MQDNSHIKLGKRIKKSRKYPLGWQYIQTIPPDEPCVLALPGSSTDNFQKANGFAKMIKEVLKDKKMPVYSVEYDLAGRCSRVDREAVLARYGQENPALPFIRQVKPEDKTYIPQYIRELYAAVLAPRLRNENGTRVPLPLAAQRLNMLVTVNHCQGSTVALQLEHLMAADMKNLGYETTAQQYLFKQLHNIHVAPVTPIGVTQTTTVKFASFSDEKVTSVHTPKVQYILNRKKEHEEFLATLNNKTQSSSEPPKKPFSMNMAVFRPTENETIFAVNNLYPLEIQKNKDLEGIEHVFAGYSDKIDDDRSIQGDRLAFCFHHVVNWMADHARRNADKFSELPDIFKEKTLAPIIKQAQDGRYGFITREAALCKSRRPHPSVPENKSR